MPRKICSLPPVNTKRWVIRRKEQIVTAVRNGVLSLEDACKRYMLSTEEFNSWCKLLDMYGKNGLRTTRTQKYINSNYSVDM